MGWVDTFPKRQEMSPTFSERLGFKAMAHLMRMTMVYSKQKVSKLQPEILTLTFYWSLLYISMYNYYIIMLKTWKRPFPTGFCWICSHVLRISTFAISKWTESPRYGPVSHHLGIITSDLRWAGARFCESIAFFYIGDTKDCDYVIKLINGGLLYVYLHILHLEPNSC